ncbi:MAG TPA: ATP-binding cassette domain-containing protein [Propionibacteriaceae bacterium]|nr:ATP-binding cassette domain-containing protein [Propionibacteriaceae bacterium]
MGKTNLEWWIDVIEFESVSKTFRDGTTAVTDLNLRVPSHNFTVIVGPSGCGKTTTLRMVNRMLEPTKGRITWDGTPMRSIRKTKLRRQMGYVIQSGGLFPHRTVLENIGTVPGLLHWDKSKIRKRSFELLSSVGLDPKLANRYPGQLSGGQQQRVGVARALAADPLVLLMDEPFSAVDPVVRGELHEFFLELQRRLSKTVILITHDVDEAIKMGDQVAILRVGGRLAQVGAPQQLLDEPVDAFVEGFIGKDRGYRRLSFVPAAGLPLDSVPVVRDVSAARDEPSLVVDADARPLGWTDRTRPTGLHPVGSTFDPEADTLRIALDAALTSPVGLAVAVNRASGRFAGVVSAQEILAQIAEVKAVQQESIALADSDQVVEAYQQTTAQPTVEDEAVGAAAGPEVGIDNSEPVKPRADSSSLAAPDVAESAEEYEAAAGVGEGDGYDRIEDDRGPEVSAEEYAAGGGGAYDPDEHDRGPEVSAEEYPAGGGGVYDRDEDPDEDDRGGEVSAEEWYAAVAGVRNRDVSESVPQEYPKRTGEGGHESDVVSAEEREPNGRDPETAEAADFTGEAAGGEGQAADWPDGPEEARATYLVENMDVGQDRAAAHPEIETPSEAGAATATEEFTGRSDHTQDDTLPLPEVSIDIAPDGLLDNGEHVRSAEWQVSDAGRAEAPVR